jgi:ketosteroid isomerase-like protein
MPHPNEATIRAVYDDIAAGSLDRVASFLADDVTWQITGSSPISGSYAGKDAVFGFFAKMMEFYSGPFTIEVHDVLANGAYGVAICTERAVVSGEALEFSSVHLWGLRDDKCFTFISYEDDDYHRFWAG